MKEFKIKKEIRFCPICEDEHEVILKKVIQTTKVKDLNIECEISVYECENCKNEYEDGEMLDANLLAIRDAYRKQVGLLTRDEIVAIREKYKLTQEDLANVLGLGEKTIARYETTTIQDKPYDVLLRTFNEDYNFAYEMLLKAKQKLSDAKFNAISDTIKGFITLNSENRYVEIQLKNNYILHDREDSSNGFRLLNINKIKSMLAYFARFTNNLYTVKLMKLFWYSDALSFLRTGRAMTGLVYTHMPKGALPIGHDKICKLDSVEKEEEEIYNNMATKFVPKAIDTIDDSLFSLEELSILQEVCEKFKDISGSELSNIMHQEEIYNITEEKEILDFSLIKFIKAF